MGNWIARDPWASLRYAHGYFRLAFQAGRLLEGCLSTNLTPTHRSAARRSARWMATRHKPRPLSRAGITAIHELTLGSPHEKSPSEFF